MKFNNKRSAIILPLKENFSNKDFGAVSVWVSEYLKHTKIKTNLIFCRKLPKNQILEMGPEIVVLFLLIVEVKKLLKELHW